MQKKHLVASPRCFRANPKGKVPIKTLEMKTFARSGNLEWKLCFEIYHNPWSKLCAFYCCATLHGSNLTNSKQAMVIYVFRFYYKSSVF